MRLYDIKQEISAIIGDASILKIIFYVVGCFPLALLWGFYIGIEPRMNENLRKHRSALRRARARLRLFIRPFKGLLTTREMMPEELIDEIADRHGLEVVILRRGVGANPCVRPEEAAVAIHAIARAADIYVSLICPLGTKIATIKRKIYYSRWN